MENKKIIHLSEMQTGLCIGTLLGDASMFVKTNGARGMQMCHCEKQKEYLEWKKEKLKPFFIAEKPSSYQSHGYENSQMSYNYRSIVHQDFTNIYGVMYRNVSGKRKKYVTRRVLNMLNDIGLLVWFLDDGCITKDREARIATNGFSEQEQHTIKKWFFQKYGIDATISFNGNNKSYFLRFRVAETNKLLKIFDKFKDEIPECMLYKFSQRLYVRYSYNNKNKDIV